MTPPTQVPADRTLRGASIGALIAWAALVALGLAWELWLAPTGRGTLALKVLPLLPAGAGLWRGRVYTCRWLSLLVWLYFCEGVVRASTDKGLSQQLALAETGLSLLLFTACVLCVRRHLELARQATA